jgi:hypothetical protein
MSPSATLPTGRDFAGLPLIRAHRFPNTLPQARGRGGLPQFPHPPSRPFRSLYPGGFIAAARPGSSRLPWPSPSTPGSAPPLQTNGAAGFASTLRTGPLARPHGTVDAGLRRRAFPPDAASLLPGALAPTGTGLTPAGECELMSGSDHRQHHLRTLGARWSLYGPQRSQSVATGGKWDGRNERLKHAKTVAVGCDRLETFMVRVVSTRPPCC